MQVRLTVGRDGMLQECQVEFEILQEYSAGGRGERIHLGYVKLNLAEYVEPSETSISPSSPSAPNNEAAGEDGIVRRYLMQDSKINSTLKLGITMRHVEGTREYYAPPLRTAPVFSGIANIIHSSEPVQTQVTTGGASTPQPLDEETVPNLSSRNKEQGEMQDMYRRSLAAFWASQPGELKADEAIEDIFSGGDGWGKGGRPAPTEQENGNGRAGGGSFAGGNSSRPDSGTSTPNPDGDGKLVDGRRGMMYIAGPRRHNKHLKTRGRVKGQGEVDEFDVREDLKSWRVGEKAYYT